MKEGFDFYRIKTEWVSEKEGGNLTKIKTEELVYAANYTEAEKVAYAIAESQNRAQFGCFSIEIIKTKINELVYNDVLVQDEMLISGLVCNFFQEDEDSGVGLYCVKVMFISEDEKTGKEKRTNENIYIPAASNIEAAQSVRKHLKAVGETREFVIRDTRFDRAASILWPLDIHQSKTAPIGA